MPKITRVRIQDFKSFKYLDLPLGRFTAILGRNDQGKSAFIQAITAPLLNPAGTGRIRHGSSALEVILYLDDEMKVHYHKAKSASYTIVTPLTSVVYDKMGRDVPKEVLSLVKPWSVEGIKPVVVQIKNQHDPVFILGEGAGSKSNLLDNIEGRIYQQAVTSCESNIRRLRRDQTQLIDQESQWNTKIASLDPLLSLATQYSVIRSHLKEYLRVLLKLYQSVSDSIHRQLEFADLCLFKFSLSTLKEVSYGLSSLAIRFDEIVYLTSLMEAQVERQKLDTAQAELDAINKVIFESGYCPLCNSKLDETHAACNK